MCESFKCQFEFKNNVFDIELNDVFSTRVQFGLIFDKIKQIIDLISNQLMTLESHVFELYDNNKKFTKISDFEFELNSQSLIRVKELNQLNDNQLNDKTVDCSESHTNKSQYSDQILIDYTSEPELQEKFKTFMSVLEDYSDNNCDLITDFEWNYVINKLLVANEVEVFDSKLLYKSLVVKYIETLEVCHNYSSAEEYFPIFDKFNSLFFNRINSFYDRLMNGRKQFLNSLSVRQKGLIKTLKQTFDSQKVEELKQNALQTLLESRIEEIKGFNLMVQAMVVPNCKRRDSDFFIHVSKSLLECGLNWEPRDCKEVFSKWIGFYKTNINAYEVMLKNENRVVEYIYQFLNIITIKDLDNICRKYLSHIKQVLPNGCNSCDFRVQNKLRICEPIDANETGISTEIVANSELNVKVFNANSVESKAKFNCVNPIDNIDNYMNVNVNKDNINKFYTFIDIIREYSDNNCDLITDFEWNYVINKQLAAKGITDSEPKLLYRSFIAKYIETLEMYSNYSSAEEVFPLFDKFNLLYFNRINNFYKRLMNARKMFLDSRIVSQKTLIQTLEQTFDTQKGEELKQNLFQEMLENKIEEIKAFSLLVQALTLYKSRFRAAELYLRASECLSEYGLDWDSDKCKQVLVFWIRFYEKNLNAYKVLQNNNRIVDYVYQFLNILTTVEFISVLNSFEIKQTIFKINQQICNKDNKFEIKVQEKLLIEGYNPKIDYKVMALPNNRMKRRKKQNRASYSDTSDDNSDSSSGESSVESSDDFSDQSIAEKSDKNSDESNKNDIKNDVKNVNPIGDLDYYMKLDLSANNIKKFSVYFNIIKEYSHNNCDLITDFEWKYVINKRLIANSIKDFDSKLLYKTFIIKYIETLENCDEYSSAKNAFPFLDECNSLYFNQINSFYERLMNARKRFMNCLSNDRKSNNTLKILKQTFDIQMSEELKQNSFQQMFENKIEEIKAFNLIVQAVGALKHRFKGSELFGKVSEILSEYGLDWDSGKCEKVLINWIKTYEKNINEYKLLMKNKKRSIEYIYQFLNIITTVELKSVFENNNEIKATIYRINKHIYNNDNKIETKVQNKLIINKQFIANIVERAQLSKSTVKRRKR